MRIARLLVFASVLMLAGVLRASAAPITVHNTGLDATGTALAASGGGASFFWTLLSAPGGATEAANSGTFRFNCCYFADVSDAAWVSPGATGNASMTGVYVYHTQVDLTGFDLSTVSISGFFGTDNDGFIRLNGGANAATTGFGGFGAHTLFSLTSGFVAGINSIELGVNNGGNPTAFMVHFDSAAANPGNGEPGVAPEPASLVLLGTGLAALVRRARRA